MSIPTDQNIPAKDFDKLSKYKDLEIETVIVGAPGMIKKGCQKHLDTISGEPQLQEIQKIVLTNTAHILRKALSI